VADAEVRAGPFSAKTLIYPYGPDGRYNPKTEAEANRRAKAVMLVEILKLHA